MKRHCYFSLQAYHAGIYSVGATHTVESKSPASIEELASMSDDALIAFLNVWRAAGRSEKEWWIEVNYNGLGTALHKLVRSQLARFEAFGPKWEQIHRPIYLRFALDAAREEMKQGTAIAFEAWVKLCQWIVSHETVAKDDQKFHEVDDVSPDWEPARRVVADFVATSLEDPVKLSLEWRTSIGDLLMNLTTGRDRWLERAEPIVRPTDPLTDAINTTRGRALETFAQFASWVQSQHGEKPSLEMKMALEMRFAGKPPLAVPEYAQLGRLFPHFHSLDQDWAAQAKDQIFPSPIGDIPWQAAFGTLIVFDRPHRVLLELLQKHYEFAIDHPEIWSKDGRRRTEFLPRIGQHVVLYYIWNLYSLEGEDSLLARFYAKNQPIVRASLMQFVGQSLKNTPEADKDVKARCMTLFESRLAVGDPSELAEFTWWLEADCLDLTWRLRQFIATMQVGKERERISTLAVTQLHRLMALNLDLVIEALAALVAAGVSANNFYLDSREVEPILKAGLNSPNKNTRSFAMAAQESLLNAGLFEYLTVA